MTSPSRLQIYEMNVWLMTFNGSIQGLISMILLVISVVQGVWTYFASNFSSIMKPATSKFLHNVTSIACLVTGMVSLIYGYKHTMSHGIVSSKQMELSLIAVAIITTILSLVGAARSSFESARKFF